MCGHGWITWLNIRLLYKIWIWTGWNVSVSVGFFKSLPFELYRISTAVLYTRSKFWWFDDIKNLNFVDGASRSELFDLIRYISAMSSQCFSVLPNLKETRKIHLAFDFEIIVVYDERWCLTMLSRAWVSGKRDQIITCCVMQNVLQPADDALIDTFDETKALCLAIPEFDSATS